MFFSDVPMTTFALLMLPVIINLWGIFHATHHTFPKENERAIWIATCIFLPILGGLIYLIFGLRRSKTIIIDTEINNNNNNNNDNNNDNNGESPNEKL